MSCSIVLYSDYVHTRHMQASLTAPCDGQLTWMWGTGNNSWREFRKYCIRWRECIYWTLSVCPESQYDGKEAIITEGHTQFTCSTHTPALLMCGVNTRFTAVAVQIWQFNRVLNWQCPPHSPPYQLLGLHCGPLRLRLHHVRRSKGRRVWTIRNMKWGYYSTD